MLSAPKPRPATGLASSVHTPHPAVMAFAEGRAAVLCDDGGAVIAFPAETATTAQLNFAIRHGSGLVHAAMPSIRLDELRIPDQWIPSAQAGTADFTVAVDAAEGITTGISAHDRAHTLRVLAAPATVPTDLVRPGHVLPIRCADGGFDERQRVWELAVDLVEAAGLSPVAVACRLVGDDGETLNDDAAIGFAQRHSLPVHVPTPAASARRHLRMAGGSHA